MDREDKVYIEDGKLGCSDELHENAKSFNYKEVAKNIISDFENLYTDDIAYCEAYIIDDWNVGCDVEVLAYDTNDLQVAWLVVRVYGEEDRQGICFRQIEVTEEYQKKGIAELLVKTCLDNIEKDNIVLVHMDFSGGFWYHMSQKYPEYNWDKTLHENLTEGIKDIKQEILDNLDKLKDLYSDYYIEDLKNKNDFNVYVWGKGVSEFDVDVLVNKKLVRFKAVHIKDNAQNKGIAMKLIDAILSTLEGDWTIEVVANINASFWNHIAGKYIHFKWIGLNDVDESLVEKIVQVGNKWQVQSEKGKNLGTYDTKAEAEKRLQQVHYFKHKSKMKEAYTPTADDFPFTLDDIIKEYEKKNVGTVVSNTYESCGPAFIMPDGRFLLSGNLLDTHADLAVQSMMDLTGKSYDDIMDEWNNDDNIVLEMFTKYFKLIRVNDGSRKDIEDRAYFVILSKTATKAQFDSLTDFIDNILINRFSTKTHTLQAFVDRAHKLWDLDYDITSDEIIDEVKTAMRAGYFLENLEEEDDNLDHDINKVIDNKNIHIILEEMLNMSATDLLAYCDYNIIHDAPEKVGPMFIIDTGKCVFVKDYYKKDLTHTEFAKNMIYRYAKKKYPKSTFIAYMYAVSEDFVEELLRKGWIRANTGSEAVDKRFYCVLPSDMDYTPTNAQYESLLKYFDLGDEYVFIYLGVQGFKFRFDEETPDEVLKDVKRYYSYGVIVEDMNDAFDSITKAELSFLNKWLDKYGFEVELVDDYEFDNDAVGMFLNTQQDNASVFPIALNKKYILDYCKDDKEELIYAIRGTLWHEAGHGIYDFLSDILDMPEDVEECVEEFARYVEDSELYDLLQKYETLDEKCNTLNEDYLDAFKDRTTKHIERVNKYASKIDRNYPNHDSDKFNELFDGYSLMSKENVTEEEQAKIDEATYLHVLNNEHHCEHWCDPKDIEGFSRKNPTPHGCLDCSKMPEHALEEMCCDWCAMSEEFGNTPFEWFDKNKDTRWHFNEEQTKFILDTLHKLWDIDESLNESTGFPITVYTYQKPQVREQLEKGETYIADYNRSMFRDYDGYEDVKHPYKELVRVLGLSNCPIFGALTKEDLIRMLDASGLDWEEENILHLEIPKENLRYTEYYDWTDYIYALEEPEQFEEESGLSLEDLENLLRTQKGSLDYDLCQVVFDKIESKWYEDGKDEEESLKESKQDIEKFKQWAGEELADRFFAVKNRLEGQKRDIYYWMKFEEDTFKRMIQYDRWKDNQEQAREYAHKTAIESLEGAIEKLEDTPTRKQLDKQAKEGAEKIYEDSRWLVVKINTYGASVKYGKNTEWCITGTNSQADGGIYDWKYHHESGGCDFYFYIDKKNNHKYALEYYDDKNWALYTEEDYVDVGMGWPFNSAMDALGEPWNPNEHTSYSAFPKVNGLPDLQQAYRDAIADWSEDDLDVNDYVAESLIESEKFDMYETDNVYQAKTYILNAVESLRVFIDEHLPLYLFGRTYECTHTDMIDLAKQNGFDTAIDDYDSKKICLLLVPNTDEYFDEKGDAFDDDYDKVYIYDTFKIYSRYIDFKKFELYKVLGTPNSVRKVRSY